MPLSKAAENHKKKAGLSLFPRTPGGPSSHEFKSMFDPSKPSTQTLGKFEPELMQMLRSQPEPDEAGKETLKKRARQNVLGRVLGSMAQLGGVAMGGDAMPLTDNVSPSLMQELEAIKANDATQLSQYYDEMFKTGMVNNRAINDYRTQGRTQQFQDDQRGKTQDFQRERQEMGFEFQDDQLGKTQKFQSGEARKRAQDAIDQIYSRGQSAINEAMAAVGVTPGTKGAKEEFSKRMTERFEKEMDRPHFAPRGAGGGINIGFGGRAGEKINDPAFMDKVREGRKHALTQLKQERNYIENSPTNFETGQNKTEQLKRLDERIKLYEQLKVSKEDQVSLDLYDIGNEIYGQDTSMGPPPVNTPTGQAQPQAPKADRNTVITTISDQIETNASKIADYQNWDPATAAMVRDMIDQAVEAGIFATQDEAAEQIIMGAQTYNSQK